MLKLKKVWLIASTIPTIILAARGFVVMIREATVDAGMKLFDMTSVIVFFLLAFAFILWLLSIIYQNIKQRLTGKGTRVNSNESQNIVGGQVIKQKHISGHSKKGTEAIVATSILAVIVAFVVWNNLCKPLQRGGRYAKATKTKEKGKTSE